MTLLEILVKELPGKGGWPCSVGSVEQGDDGSIYDNSSGYMSGFTMSLAKDWLNGMVIREQYEAELAESKKVAWDGEGLPPVGCECEIAASTRYLNITHPEGAVVKIYSLFTDDRGVELAAFVDAAGKFGGVCTAKCFRPLRSEEERKRDAVIASIKEMLMYDYGDDPRLNDAVILYDAIAAGKIPHVKIV